MAHSVSVDLTYSPIMVELFDLKTFSAVLSPASLGENITGPGSVSTSDSTFPYMLLFENVEVGNYNVTSSILNTAGDVLVQTTTPVTVSSESPAAFNGGRGGLHFSKTIEGVKIPIPVSIVIDSGISRK